MEVKLRKCSMRAVAFYVEAAHPHVSAHAALRDERKDGANHGGNVQSLAPPGPLKWRCEGGERWPIQSARCVFS